MLQSFPAYRCARAVRAGIACAGGSTPNVFSCWPSEARLLAQASVVWAPS